jgi:ribA/ribD-fused uncharacterized protein
MHPSEHLAALVEAEAAGSEIGFLFFWGHQPQRDGSVGPGCLSQWWPAPFTVSGTVYPTAEHWMMAAKACLFGDQETLAAVLSTDSPRMAKAAGRQVRGFDEQTWEAARFDLVITGNYAKFTQNPELGRYLARTGSKVLVEASPYDAVWGIGMRAGHKHAAQPSRWRGLNLLGFALMNVRQSI